MKYAKVYSFSFQNNQVQWISLHVQIHTGLNQIHFVGLNEKMQKNYKIRLQMYYKKHFKRFPRGNVHILLEGLEKKEETYQGDYFFPLLFALRLAEEELYAGQNYFAYGEVDTDDTLYLGKESIPYLALFLEKWKEKDLAFQIFPSLALHQMFEKQINLQLSKLKSPFIEITQVSHFLYTLKKNTLLSPAYNKKIFSFLEKRSLLSSPMEESHEIHRNSVHFQEDLLPLSLLKNQSFALDALLLACAGGHSLLLIGSAGCGKSNLACWANELLFSLSEEKNFALWLLAYSQSYPCFPETQKKYCYLHPSQNFEKWKFLQKKEIYPKQMLIWDELCLYEKRRMQLLLEYLEKGDKMETEENLLHIACTNPCPCGLFLEREKLCNCSKGKILAYQKHLSSSLLQRFDLKIEMVKPEQIEMLDQEKEQSFLESLQRKIRQAKHMCVQRQQEKSNAFLSEKELLENGHLHKEIKENMAELYQEFSLPARSFYKLLRLGRTQADLEGEVEVKIAHLWTVFSFMGTHLDSLFLASQNKS